MIPPGPATSSTTSSGKPNGIRRPNFVQVCVSSLRLRPSPGQNVVVDMFMGLKSRSDANSVYGLFAYFEMRYAPVINIYEGCLT